MTTPLIVARSARWAKAGLLTQTVAQRRRAERTPKR
jgi:hypothetical protein